MASASCPCGLQQPVLARAGLRVVVAARIGEQNLVDADLRLAEGLGRASHVEPPDAIGLEIDVVEQVALAAFEAVDPVVQGALVVLAETLDIAQLEAGVLRLGGDDRQRGQRSIGKDVLADEGRPLLFVLVERRDDAVVQEGAAGLQQLFDGVEVGAEVLPADVLEHADAGDLVEGWDIV